VRLPHSSINRVSFSSYLGARTVPLSGFAFITRKEAIFDRSAARPLLLRVAPTGASGLLIMQNHEVIRMQSISEGVRLFASPGRESFLSNELLAGITREVYSQFEKRIDIEQYEPREVVFEEDDPGDALYLIAQGSVKISKKGRGGQQETLTHLMEGDFFGEMALIDSGNRSAQAVAVGQTILGRVDRQAWDLLLRLAPHEVLGNFTRSVTRRLRQNNEHFIEQMMRTERLSLLGATISAIVHDLNNPIGQILCVCTAVQTEPHDDATTIEAMRIIRDAVGRMQIMTQELIDFSRGKIQLYLHSVSTGELLRNLEPEFAQFGPRVTVRIEAAYEGELKIDMPRFSRVFANLIRNARESMQDGCPSELRFSIKQVDGNVRFEISDSGCGIPRELLPKIFEPFVTHGKKNGSGLGLAISKAIVEAHGGTISVSSGNKGTSFQIDLPLR
jgi:signal transduction histidine kinase